MRGCCTQGCVGPVPQHPVLTRHTEGWSLDPPSVPSAGFTELNETRMGLAELAEGSLLQVKNLNYINYVIIFKIL